METSRFVINSEVPATHRLSFGHQSICHLVIPPASMVHMQNLVEIRLPHNKLKTVPLSLFKLTQLEVLNLESNLLEDAGEDRLWRGMVRLRVLFLGSNLLNEVPSAVGRLPRLFYLDVSDNPRLGCLPVEMLGSASLGTLAANRCDAEGMYLETRRKRSVPSLKDICLRSIYAAIDLCQIGCGAGAGLREVCEEIRRRPQEYCVAELLLNLLDSVKGMPLCSVCARPVFFKTFEVVRRAGEWELPFKWMCCSSECREVADVQQVTTKLTLR
ncbi:hypothetical protein BX661DRAFT_200588 [Kickxella alabastrina]|uniref:uncharacterized protein n=1 Tax=Kickxella alabastrina TaxID=61397 RepID=UPI00221F5EE6|nr:uncharacterized protein BX661DRAFT_200588 [Kickxella alabastrina]KAI7821828.1 hypothetical protein BX661DRAFT_200588 [Kickxella alabastrina]